MDSQFAVLRRALRHQTRHHGNPEPFSGAAKDAVDGAEFELAKGADPALLQESFETGAIGTALAQDEDVGTPRRSHSFLERAKFRRHDENHFFGEDLGLDDFSALDRPCHERSLQSAGEHFFDQMPRRAHGQDEIYFRKLPPVGG